MSKYIDAEKLKRFIEIKMEALWDKLPDADKERPTDIELRDLGMYMALEGLIDDLDSFQQEQPIQVSTLTWKDINDLERIINNVHYEFRNGIGEKSFGEEVLERFREERDEQEQPKVDLEKVIDNYLDTIQAWQIQEAPFTTMEKCARHFYELGQQEMRHRITNPEYNVKVVEQLKSEYPIIKEE